MVGFLRSGHIELLISYAIFVLQYKLSEKKNPRPPPLLLGHVSGHGRHSLTPPTTTGSWRGLHRLTGGAAVDDAGLGQPLLQLQHGEARLARLAGAAGHQVLGLVALVKHNLGGVKEDHAPKQNAHTCTTVERESVEVKNISWSSSITEI